MLDQPFVVPSLLFAVLTLPLILGIIPRNRGYGIRTAVTLADDQSWYRANRFGGWMLFLSSLTYLLVAALDPTPLPARTDLCIWLLHLAAFFVPLFSSMVFIRRFIARLDATKK